MNKNLLNKPKVFLSHSKKDAEFIHRLCKDLRLCQIEPWLDSQEIRHGQPWLDAIFESGIPTCDAILIYLTENSIESPVVKKEIDASIIKKLKESHVAFLPYVSKEILRDQLRLDIQALQTLEWNKQNYAEMLPRVVAEIWHSYLDRVVLSVAKDEKVRRLEAELELEKLKRDDIFDAQENADFEFIWGQFDYNDIINVSCYTRNKDGSKGEKTHYAFKVRLQTIIPQLDKIDDLDYSFNCLVRFLKEFFKTVLPAVEKEKYIELKWTRLFDFMNELQMYGLIKRSQKIETPFGGSDSGLQTTNCLVLADKLYRFKYWLAHKGILPNEIKCEKIDVGMTLPEDI
jgi:hypothetical protein